MESSLLIKPAGPRAPDPLPPPRLHLPVYPPLPQEFVVSDSDIIVADSDSDGNNEGSGSEFSRSAKRRRIEIYAQRYLAGEGLYIHSARLRGPVIKNPWSKMARKEQEAQRKRGVGDRALERVKKQELGARIVIEATPTQRPSSAIQEQEGFEQIVASPVGPRRTQTRSKAVPRRPRTASGKEKVDDVFTTEPTVRRRATSRPEIAEPEPTIAATRTRSGKASTKATTRKPANTRKKPKPTDDDSYRETVEAESKPKARKRKTRNSDAVVSADTLTSASTTAIPKKKPINTRPRTVSNVTRGQVPKARAPPTTTPNKKPSEMSSRASSVSSKNAGLVDSIKVISPIESRIHDMATPRALPGLASVHGHSSPNLPFSQSAPQFGTVSSARLQPVRSLAGRPQSVLRKETERTLSYFRTPKAVPDTSPTANKGKRKAEDSYHTPIEHAKNGDSEEEVHGSFRFKRIRRGTSAAPAVGAHNDEDPKQASKSPPLQGMGKQPKPRKPKAVDFAALSPFGGGQVVSRKGENYNPSLQSLPAPLEQLEPQLEPQLEGGTIRVQERGVPDAHKVENQTCSSRPSTANAQMTKATISKPSKSPVTQIPRSSVPISASQPVPKSTPGTNGDTIHVDPPRSASQRSGRNYHLDNNFQADQESPSKNWLSTQNQLSAAKKGFMSAILDSPLTFSPDVSLNSLSQPELHTPSLNLPRPPIPTLKRSTTNPLQRETPGLKKKQRPEKRLPDVIEGNSISVHSPDVPNLEVKPTDRPPSSRRALSPPVSRTSPNEDNEAILSSPPVLLGRMLPSSSPAPPSPSRLQLSTPPKPKDSRASNGYTHTEGGDFSPFKTFDTPTKSQFGPLPGFSPLRYSPPKPLPVLREGTGERSSQDRNRDLPLSQSRSVRKSFEETPKAPAINNRDGGNGGGPQWLGISRSNGFSFFNSDGLTDSPNGGVKNNATLPESPSHFATSSFNPGGNKDPFPAASSAVNTPYKAHGGEDARGRDQQTSPTLHSQENRNRNNTLSPSKKLAGDMLEILGGGLWDIDEELKKMGTTTPVRSGVPGGAAGARSGGRSTGKSSGVKKAFGRWGR